MKEIDQMLDQWIHNSIIRAKLRDLIIKELKIGIYKPKSVRPNGNKLKQ